MGKFLVIFAGLIGLTLVGAGVYGFITDKVDYGMVMMSGVYIVSLTALGFLASKRQENIPN